MPAVCRCIISPGSACVVLATGNLGSKGVHKTPRVIIASPHRSSPSCTDGSTLWCKPITVINTDNTTREIGTNGPAPSCTSATQPSVMCVVPRDTAHYGVQDSSARL